jgi:hypothetical protein
MFGINATLSVIGLASQHDYPSALWGTIGNGILLPTVVNLNIGRRKVTNDTIEKNNANSNYVCRSSLGANSV